MSHATADAAPDYLQPLRVADNSPLVPWPDWNGAMPVFERRETQKRELDHLPEMQIDVMREEAIRTISSFRNSTVLLMGDSVDRNFVDQFAWLTQAVHGQESFDGRPLNTSDIKSWGQPHTALIGSGVNLKLANLFFYGALDEEDLFSSAPDWLAPGRAEDRIDALFKPYADRLEHPVGLIQFSAGRACLTELGS